MPYGRNVVISRLWFLSFCASRFTAGCFVHYVGGVSVDRMSFICFYIPHSEFSIPHLRGGAPEKLKGEGG